MPGTAASGEESGSRSWRGWHAPPAPSFWRRYWPALLLLATAALVAWKLHTSSAYFPRRESDFLSPATIDRRLDKLTKRLRDNPDDLSAMVDSGILLYQKGRDYYPDAVNELHDAWMGGALDVRIFYYTGMMYQQLGMPPGFAIEQFERFLRNRPDDVDVRLLLAKLLYQSGLEKDDKKAADKEHQHDREKIMEDAIAQYQLLKKRLPKNPVVSENLALSLQSLKRYDEAKAELASLARLGPQEARRSHLYLAEIATEQGDDRQAMREYLQLLPLEGQADLGTPPAVICATIAETYDRLKAPELAKDFWEKAAQLDPKNRKAQTRLTALKKQLAKKKPARSRKK